MDQDLRQKFEIEIVNAMDVAVKRSMIWGDDDCAMWTCNIIQKVLGYDPGIDFRGKYFSSEGAHRELGKLGLGFAWHHIAKFRGWKRVYPMQAQPGDIGLMMFNKKPVTLICRKQGWFVGRNESACTLLHAKFIKLSWSVVNA